MLVFVDPAQRPVAEAELAHYGTHRNDPADPRYRAFLNRLAEPLTARLAPGAEGLDFGSGPGPTLSVMLREMGFRTWIYDPFFAPDPTVLERRYDFVTATEVLEHLFHPAEEMDRIDRMLRPGGWLGVMTGMLRKGRELDGWRYARDPTHVCFYSDAALEWVAADRGWTLEIPREDVALFRKPAEVPPGASGITQ